jgi:hypothetical protein
MNVYIICAVRNGNPERLATMLKAYVMQDIESTFRLKTHRRTTLQVRQFALRTYPRCVTPTKSMYFGMWKALARISI